MKDKIKKEIGLLDKKIERYEGKVDTSVRRLQETINLDINNILSFAQGDLDRIKEYHSKLEGLKEQKETLEYLLNDEE